jgi:hypothetical protein
MTKRTARLAAWANNRGMMQTSIFFNNHDLMLSYECSVKKCFFTTLLKNG